MKIIRKRNEIKNKIKYEKDNKYNLGWGSEWKNKLSNRYDNQGLEEETKKLIESLEKSNLSEESKNKIIRLAKVGDSISHHILSLIEKDLNKIKKLENKLRKEVKK